MVWGKEGLGLKEGKDTEREGRRVEGLWEGMEWEGGKREGGGRIGEGREDGHWRRETDGREGGKKGRDSGIY